MYLVTKAIQPDSDIVLTAPNGRDASRGLVLNGTSSGIPVIM